MREQFIDKVFYGRAQTIILQANTIIAEYQRAGFVLTLRQLYYQFVARGLLKNDIREYKRLGTIISDARLAGLIDWDAIEDRTRNLRSPAHWDRPETVLQSAAAQFRLDLWADQARRVEVWIEKDALVGVIEAVCEEYRLPYFACRGYSSQSEQYSAGKRFNSYGQYVIILHLGDHDPSGIDMTRDNTDRLSLFAGVPIEVRRLALNMAQVREFNPPPNPTKFTDSRANEYVAQFGESCWELDALDPRTIADLISSEVETLIDRDAWDNALAAETEQRQQLSRLATNWSNIQWTITE